MQKCNKDENHEIKRNTEHMEGVDSELQRKGGDDYCENALPQTSPSPKFTDF